MDNKPKISFVVCSRNDNHGGDMLKRMRIFTKGLLHQCKKHALRAECIFVEWNPIEGKALLKDILPLPTDKDLLDIRFIQVPNSVHLSLKHSDKIPLYQMIAKNVGIRRAKADLICCTNVDLLFSDELMLDIKNTSVETGNFYRSNRCDIPREIDENSSVEDQLTYSSKNILQRLGKNRRFPELVDSKGMLHHIPGYSDILALPKKLKNFFFSISVDDQIKTLDTVACGDFTMMHREDWNKIEGYYELEAYSIHIDSLAIYCAFAIGLKQKILHWKSCTYHISHDNGWEMVEPVKKMIFDIEKPMLDWSTVEQVAKKMITEQKPVLLNKPTWGYANENFKEYIFEPGKEMVEVN